MAYRNTFFRWLFLYSLTFGLTYVLKLFTYLCPETGQFAGCRMSLLTLRKNSLILWMKFVLQNKFQKELSCAVIKTAQ